MYHAFELRSLIYYSIPTKITAISSCTRSVRLVVGSVTKWQTCFPNITKLFISFANGVRLGCQAGPRSKRYSHFFTTKSHYYLANLLRRWVRGRLFFHFFMRFFTIFYDYCRFLLNTSIFYCFLSAATVGSGFFIAFCIVFVLKYQGGEGFRHRTSTYLTRPIPILQLTR